MGVLSQEERDEAPLRLGTAASKKNDMNPRQQQGEKETEVSTTLEVLGFVS